MYWPNAQLPPQTTKTVLITGANTGIGFHTANTLAELGAHVVLACRSQRRMADAESAIEASNPTAKLTKVHLDLSDLDNVRSFPKRLDAAGIHKLDVLVLNAGVAPIDFRTSRQGFELMFAVNHLAHYLLAGVLLPIMKDVPGSRIISVSSLAHLRATGIDYNTALGNGDSFHALSAYRESKLANLWFTAALEKRLRKARVQTVAVAAHPGVAKTDLTRHLNGSWMLSLAVTVLGWFGQSGVEGSWPIVMAAAEENVKGNEFYSPGGGLGLSGVPVRGGWKSSTAMNPRGAESLWRISEGLTGFQYDLKARKA